MNVTTPISMTSAMLRPVALAATVAAIAVLALTPGPLEAAEAVPDDPTFSRDIAPILQRSCQKCHRPNALAPMSLITYEEVRPWARSIKYRTGLRDKLGVMPPWYIEKSIGIQEFKDDWSLSDDEIATIARWADNGAPQGDPADMPEPPPFIDVDEWEIGEPDLIVSSPEFEVAAEQPDWWGALGTVETGMTEDRYVAAVEYKERNNMQRGVRSNTVGGLFVVHHSALYVQGPDEDDQPVSWPVAEVGRNADIFDEEAGRLIEAGSRLIFPTTHLHANGTDVRAHLDVGFKFHPKGYKPTKEMQLLFFGNGPDLDIRAMEKDQRAEAFLTLTENSKISVFEPHMHAPGVRMCIDAIYNSQSRTLNCAGYDHSWVRVYKYADDAAPLLPKGTVLRLTGYFDNTPSNPNVPDPRNWSGSGQRSVDNMFINLMQAIYLDDEEFAAEVAEREAALDANGGFDIGCLTCGLPDEDPTAGGGDN